MEQEMENFFMTSVRGTKSVEDAFRTMAAEMIAELYRVFVVESMVKSISGAFTGFNPFEALSFDGGGYTGDKPRSGGIDGKGGFMAILHPQETVIDHTKKDKETLLIDSLKKLLGEISYNTIETPRNTIEAPKFEGGGYTGNRPRTGGLDGKGGFMAMLHPQETVIDHTRKDGKNTSEIINITQNITFSNDVEPTIEAKVRNMAPQIAEQAVFAVKDRQNRGGAYRR